MPKCQYQCARPCEGACLLRELCKLLDMPQDSSVIAIFERAARIEGDHEASGRAHADFHEYWKWHKIFPPYVLVVLERLRHEADAHIMNGAHGGAS